MATSERIARRPEYDAEDWEAVGKLKEYVEGLGFTFVEKENHISFNVDCCISWNGLYASSVGFGKTIPGIAKPLKNFEHLTEVDIWFTVDDLGWLCELSGIRCLYFWGFNETTPVSKFLGAHIPLKKPIIPARMNQAWIFCHFGRHPLKPQKYSHHFNVSKCCKSPHNLLNS